MKLPRLLLSLGLLVAADSRSTAQGLKERLTLPAHEEWVRCLAFSPDGETLATASRRHDRQKNQASGELKLWDVTAGKERGTLEGHQQAIEAVAFSSDGKTLATGGGDSLIKLWDRETGKERLSFRGPTYGIRCLAFGPDGKALGCANYLEVRLQDAATGREMSSFKRLVNGDFPVFSPDLKTLAAPNHQDVDLYDVVTGKERLVLEDHRGGVSRLAFSADGKTLAVASTRSEDRKYFSEVKLWDPATGRERAVFKDRVGFLRSLAISPDGKLLALAGSKELDGPHEVKLIDVLTGRELAVVTIKPADRVSCLAFSPDGQRLAAGTGKTLMIWDVVPPSGEHK